jgi:4'-phosphopantetheinyl transferase
MMRIDLTETGVLQPGPASALALGSSDLHVWAFLLDQPGPSVGEFLSADEKERANRYHLEEDRSRFIAARGTLRQILSAYTHVSPEAIAFEYGEQGKPVMRQHLEVHFNLSHSHDLALVALTRVGPVGVDVEHVRAVRRFLDIARTHYSEWGRDIGETASEREQLQAFFWGWTRTEAYVKAVGHRRSLPLKELKLSPAQRGDGDLVTVTNPSGGVTSWFLHSFHPASDFVAAVAVEGRPDAPHYWIWE